MSEVDDDQVKKDQEAAEAKAKAEADAAKKTEGEPKGLTEEEVNKRVEAARKQEKDKLYGKIDDLEKVVQELNTARKAEQEAKDKAEAEAKAKAEAKRQADLSNEDRLAEQMKEFKEELAKEAAERVRLEAKLKQKDEEAELQEYKQQVISGEEELIPELVGGNSKEDIDRSIALAKSRYQELFQASKKKAEGNVKNNMPGPTDPDPAALEEAELLNKVENLQIDPKRYARDYKYRAEMDEKRQAVLDNVGNAYKRSVGR